MSTPEMQASVGELQALRQELERQRQEHTQEVERVRQESAQRLQEGTQAALQAQGNLGMVPQVIQEMGRALQTAINDQNKELVEDMKDSGKKDQLCLVDTKGLGKPTANSAVKQNSTCHGDIAWHRTSAQSTWVERSPGMVRRKRVRASAQTSWTRRLEKAPMKSTTF